MPCFRISNLGRFPKRTCVPCLQATESGKTLKALKAARKLERMVSMSTNAKATKATKAKPVAKDIKGAILEAASTRLHKELGAKRISIKRPLPSTPGRASSVCD
jgi:hypothetical protein